LKNALGASCLAIYLYFPVAVSKDAARRRTLPRRGSGVHAGHGALALTAVLEEIVEAMRSVPHDAGRFIGVERRLAV
jgi:hypothetical protein